MKCKRCDKTLKRIRIGSSGLCRNCVQIGKVLSDEHKRKIGLACSIATKRLWQNPEYRKKIVKSFSERQKGKVSPMKGRKRPEMRGEKNYHWKGGITSLVEQIRKSPEYKEWRGQVFRRDNWICRDCRKEGGRLHAHHIKGFADYPALRFEISNGLTLHKGCHQNNHKVIKIK